MPPSVALTYCRNLTEILSIAPIATGPHFISFTLEASERLREFEAWLEPQLAKYGPLGGIADWASKLAGEVARLAAILHVAEHVGADGSWQAPIEASTVENAIELGRFYLAHAKAAFAEMGADPEIENAKHVLAW